MVKFQKIRSSFVPAFLIVAIFSGLAVSTASTELQAQQGPTYKGTLERCLNRANKLWGKRDSKCKYKSPKKKRKRCYRANKKKYQRRVAECKQRYK